jgi:hypothetical protein
VVPGTGARRGNPDSDPLVEHRLHKRLEVIGIWTVVALEEIDTDSPKQVRIIGDFRGSLNGDAPEIFIDHAVFHETADLRVPTEVDGLLRFRLGFEADVAVDDREPHGDQMWLAGWADGCQRHGTGAVEEPLDLLVLEGDCRS